MVKMKISSFNGLNYVAQETTPADFVQEKVVIKRQKSITQLLKEIDEAMQKLPEKSRKPIDFYKPEDYDVDAPADVDPRVDDGKVPPAPNNVVTVKSGDTATITFQPNTDADIVGYRIYRSDNHGKFQLMGGKVVLAGAEAKFIDQLQTASYNRVLCYCCRCSRQRICTKPVLVYRWKHPRFIDHSRCR